MNQAILKLSAAIVKKQVAVLATVIEVKDASPAKVEAQVVLAEIIAVRRGGKAAAR